MLIFLEGPDGSGKDTVAQYLSKLIGYPVIDTLSGELIFREFQTPEMKFYWVLHELEYLKHIRRAIKVRHPVVSHFYYHPEQMQKIPEIPCSHIFLLKAEWLNGTDEFEKIIKSLGYKYTPIEYEHTGIKSLHKAATQIAARVREMEGATCCRHCRV